MASEQPSMMIMHAAVIGVLLYAGMRLVLGQEQVVAEARSIVLAALVLVYMVLFGHGLPRRLNPQLGFI